MRLSTICITTFLAVASVGIAQANLVTNGDFSQTNGVNTPTEFGTSYSAGDFVTGWQGNNGYGIWFSNLYDATHVSANGRWTSTGKEMLYDTITSVPHGATAFVGLDGEQTDGVQASIGQQLNGLTIGATYNVSFDWGASQLQSRTGATTEFLRVFLGDDFQDTSTVSNDSGGFNGWFSTSLQFVADSTSAFLKFLSFGTPTGLPPIAVLTNVSVTQAVPEPSTLFLFGSGLVGLGLMARRRATRRHGDSDKS